MYTYAPYHWKPKLIIIYYCYPLFSLSKLGTDNMMLFSGWVRLLRAALCISVALKKKIFSTLQI